MTLPQSRFYIKSCLVYDQMVNAVYLKNVHKASMVLRGNCNAGSSVTTKKGLLGHPLEFWVVEHGIANLLSLGWLEAHDFQVNKDKLGWVVITPGGQELRFNCDAGMIKGFPYVELSDLKKACGQGLPTSKPAMVQTV